MKVRIEKKALTWEATSAVFCFGGGMLAGLFGALLTASTWVLGGEQHPWLRATGTALLIATIPLVIFAGYCLDWMEREPKQRESDRSRHGSQNGTASFVAAAAFFTLLLPAGLCAQQINKPQAEKGDVSNNGTSHSPKETSAATAASSASSIEANKSESSERERLLLERERVDQQERGLAEPEARVRTGSRSDSNEAVTTADSSSSV